jgi:hypothetical protein
MIRHKRKNNALNNAAAGFERGLGNGMQLGMQARRQSADEESDAFQREQVLRAGMRADQALRLEQGQRDAEGAAVAELGADEPKVDFSTQPGLSPMQNVGMQQAKATVQYDQTAARVAQIAKKMSEMGTPLGQVKAFLDTAKEKHTKAVDDGERKFLVDAISRDVQSDTLFTTLPDGSRASNPETEKAAQQLIEMAANPNVPLESLRAGRIALKRGISADRSRLAHRKSMVMSLDTDLANVTQFTTQAGPITPAQADAQSRQMQRLQTLRDQFDVFYDEIHGAKGGPMAFSEQWSNAKNGIAFTNPRTGRPVTFAEEDAVRESEQIIAAQEQELNAYKMETERARAAKFSADAAAVPGKVENDRLNATANLARASSYGAKANNPDKGLQLSAKLKDSPLFKNEKGDETGVPQWAYDQPELVAVLETLPQALRKLGPNSAKAFYEAVQSVPMEMRDAFLDDWIDEGEDIDVAEWLKDNE